MCPAYCQVRRKISSCSSRATAGSTYQSQGIVPLPRWSPSREMLAGSRRRPRHRSAPAQAAPRGRQPRTVVERPVGDDPARRRARALSVESCSSSGWSCPAATTMPRPRGSRGHAPARAPVLVVERLVDLVEQQDRRVGLVRGREAEPCPHPLRVARAGRSNELPRPLAACTFVVARRASRPRARRARRAAAHSPVPVSGAHHAGADREERADPSLDLDRAGVRDVRHPAIVRSSVVLPPPLRPTSATASPGPISRSTSRSPHELVPVLRARTARASARRGAAAGRRGTRPRRPRATIRALILRPASRTDVCSRR